ncbi:hypothetical protein PVAP13_9KG633300 [Panicum virgatum]|uniref:Uncharacterized protein n=1 Tax=Panicum virgatum TaxID=38727 RepID=A0A8T0NX61_PANVG|nr:hypothetical protein PVAP13_9KG633300 [Panicum virgatum]
MSPPPRQGHGHGHAGRGGMRVVDVWAHNQDQELARIRELARGFPIAAVAVSHEGPPAFLLSGQTFPHTLEGNYEAVRASVERATSAQVGLALASRDGELAMGGRVWRFHLGAGAGLANPRRVCLGIRAHARATMPRGALVTSDGAEDAAYLIRHIVDGGLPRRRDEFLRACGVCFPALYDLRVLAEWTTPAGHPPPLAAAAAGGGSGAFRAFLALAQDAWFWEVKVAYSAFLYGLGAADNEFLVRRKIDKAEHEERDRRLRELLLLQGHDEAFVRNISFF